MTELRFTLNQRLDKDTNWSVAFSHLVDSEEEAEEAGRQSQRLFTAFSLGYASRQKESE